MSQIRSTVEFVFTIAIICLSVTNSDCQYLYGSSEPAEQVKWVRGHEFVLDIPKYNMKITSTIKDDGQDGCYSQHEPDCDCDECSSQAYEKEDTNPWTTYELVPVEYTTANAPAHSEHQGTYQELMHSEPHTVYHQAAPADDPVLGSPRHKHKQDWYYSAPSWIPNGDGNMNILRTADPRAVIKSNKHFVKVNNKHAGKSFVHSHSSSFVKTKPIHVHQHGGGLSVHKNVHVHKFRNNNYDEHVEHGRLGAARQVDNRFVGSHMFAAPRWRRDTLTRRKRGVLEFVRLVGDHDTKIDMSKTAENVGAATKNVFENEKSPVYHMRNVVGSSQDALMGMLSARPRGVLIPSKYRIVSADETPIVRAINPRLYQENGQEGAQEDDEQYADAQPESEEVTDEYAGRSPVEYDDTFSRIGTILRESVQRAHKSAEHAVDAVHSARQVVATARKYWPRMLLPYVGAVEVEKRERGAETVGSAQDPQFVGIGRIMDYFGVTGEHPPTEPRLGAAARRISEEEQLLNNAKNSLGTATYRQFMEKMKKELGRYQRLQPKASDGEQVGSRLLSRLPLRPRPVVRRPLLLDPRLHRIRNALRVPPKPLLRPVKRPSPALLKLREALRPRIRNPLLGAPKPQTPGESPALTKLRDALKIPPKPETRVEKPVSPALAKLREAIAQRKAARKSPLVGKAQSVAADDDEENEVEPKPKSAATSADYVYSDEDTDKSVPEDKTDPAVGGPRAPAIITSPNLDDSEEVKPDSDTVKTDSKKEPPSSVLERLRTKLQDKPKLPASNVDNGDLLGRALEILRTRAHQRAGQKSEPLAVEDVGGAQLTTQASTGDKDTKLGSPGDPGEVKFAAVPLPIFTKEMKTPFMGFASKKDLDEYFKNLYCAECKKSREADDT